ncbi:hypothetical protein TVAG_481340 [Trichomonas vaginalis G3]|uniref:DUF3447 domain-containing protein n=1 Tax=Trichomonas vaginalis (strain ATCC PRA-98 / G3) TaxID=412133 RepID=A2F209_TRIV3|nr:protein of unknown function (DUF3447) [Trichomonas vaginalis G3]EAY01064.1 hypothetical protein TVAG_481340 [Trichomonas vaginalis G3]KAI5515498.1 protein of unknown function (DUF3447) [Trichomonas vaginalis G3]|eukprot:XP_001313936.1 hypothetical protein [Trichomonas vaginalis G3]
MSEQDIHPNKFSKLRSIYKYYIDSYNALYQLKTDKEEELKEIYKKIKTELIDSKTYSPTKIRKDISNIIPYNNRYTKSYLYLAKLLSDDYHIPEVNCAETLALYKEDTIYRAIMYNDLERFISFTEREGFDKDKMLESSLYPHSYKKYSLIELCCYHGAVDCFKVLRTKFSTKINGRCLLFSFLGGNQEIMSECLKYQTPDRFCMEYAIISHNIDFVTFLKNEYDLWIDLDCCAINNNLESFLVCFDQTNDVDKCFINLVIFNIPSLCEYFLSKGAYINETDIFGETALHIAARYNSKETVKFLISHRININKKIMMGEPLFILQY